MSFTIIRSSFSEKNPQQLEIDKLFMNMSVDLIINALSQGVSIETRHSNSGETLLMSAAVQKNLEVVKYLSEHGADINATDSLRRNALITMAFCQSYTPTVAQYLIDKGLDVNFKDCDGKTALMFAVEGHMWGYRGNLSAVKHLIKNGADPFIERVNGKTAYDYAVAANEKSKTRSNQSIVDYLSAVISERKAIELSFLCNCKITSRDLEQQIGKVERLNVRLFTKNGRQVRSDSTGFVDYPFQRAANGTLTVSGWKNLRFFPNYAGYDIEILDENGNVVHGRTVLANIR